jgi:HNH endonuclease
MKFSKWHPPPPIEERLRNYVEKPGPPQVSTPCRIWQGTVNKDGYGVLSWDNDGERYSRVHRITWVIHFGPIPNGLWVLHHCDCPGCINPDHLYLGDAQSNMDAKMERGRNVNVTGEDHGCSKFSWKDVSLIRYFLNQGWSCTRLAERYGVTRSAIELIRDWKSWKHVQAFEPIEGQPLPQPPSLPNVFRRPIVHKTPRSRFRGVYRDVNRWRACLWLDGGNLHLGGFDTEIEAAQCWNDHIIRLDLDRPLNQIPSATAPIYRRF